MYSGDRVIESELNWKKILLFSLRRDCSSISNYVPEYREQKGATSFRPSDKLFCFFNSMSKTVAKWTSKQMNVGPKGIQHWTIWKLNGILRPKARCFNAVIFGGKNMWPHFRDHWLKHTCVQRPWRPYTWVSPTPGLPEEQQRYQTRFLHFVVRAGNVQADAKMVTSIDSITKGEWTVKRGTPGSADSIHRFWLLARILHLGGLRASDSLE